jgi:acyl-CoA reductase-like NAD-dependent aldehyde dehydrogenase
MAVKCDAIKRLLVHHSQFSQAVTALASYVTKIKIGDPENKETERDILPAELKLAASILIMEITGNRVRRLVAIKHRKRSRNLSITTIFVVVQHLYVVIRVALG